MPLAPLNQGSRKKLLPLPLYMAVRAVDFSIRSASKFLIMVARNYPKSVDLSDRKRVTSITKTLNSDQIKRFHQYFDIPDYKY